MSRSKLLRLSQAGTAFALLLLVGCSDSSPIDPTNGPPAIPSIIMPQHQASNVSVSPLLHWTCNDPDGDSVKYDVYLDTVSTPRIVSSQQSKVVYSPDTLVSNQKYYWKIVARDGKGDSSVSPVWNFTTTEAPHWSALAGGMNGKVFSLVSFNGKLVAGGSFTTAGGVAAQNIAAWDGSSWSPLGEGVSSDSSGFYIASVGALAVYRGQLIAAGAFNLAGGKPVNRIAMWNGSEWNALGEGIIDGVSAIAVFRDRLIVGGSFDSTSSALTSNVSSWDGTSWSYVGSGINGMASVFSMFVSDDKLIVGGSPNSTLTGCAVAIWDGISWTSLSSNHGLDVSSITVFDQKIAVTGLSGVSTWDGSDWQIIESNLENTRHWFTGGSGSALEVYRDQLILGGSFNKMNGVSMDFIAAWDGSQWSPVGLGADDDVYALLTYNNQLIVGGRFRSVGGVMANRIAAWGN
jgi:hypothetical protein